MKKIEENIFSRYQAETLSEKKSWNHSTTSVSKVRLSSGYPIKTFRELVSEVAIVSLKNKNYDIFYRGQNKDYKDKNQKTVIYPTICRPDKKENGEYKASIRKINITERYSKLKEFTDYYRISSKNFDEYYYTLFQHYDILPTPLIDITQSLRVAATFALKDSECGFLYVFGLPYPQGSISHFIDQQIVLIKLQNVSPQNALRPRYQEGFLVGKLPILPTKEGGDNLARRLIAKYLLVNNPNESFWDANFKKMPNEVLYPQDDEYEKHIEDKKNNFDKRNK